MLSIYLPFSAAVARINETINNAISSLLVYVRSVMLCVPFHAHLSDNNGTS